MRGQEIRNEGIPFAPFGVIRVIRNFEIGEKDGHENF